MRHLKNPLLTLGLILAVLLLGLPQEAQADPTGKAIKSKTEKAMGEYDMMEFEAAKSMRATSWLLPISI
jgi:hypothetical protein